ncbi:DMT family transporter [Halomonas salipaludis]|uniref:EamA family transporter n=1 Tax=Halomonas salipaludis TaxID=2032625 RepID=A0A2A2ET55_9GAMM|nr:DMT family transporter [Halomonas salipaludis]PAU75542.1 EamA family transporter [Halomonas salipaludis]
MNVALYAITVLIWGTTWIAIAFQLGEVPVTLSVFYRFALAAALLLLWLLATRRLQRIGARDHLFCALQGMCVFCLNFYLFYTATGYITSGLNSVVFSMAVLFNAVNGVFFFRQAITSRLLVAVTLGFIGMVCLFWPDIRSETLDIGVLFGLGCSLLGTYGFSLGNMLSLRHQRRGLDLLSTNAYAMGYGALIMLIIVLISGVPFVLDTSPAYLGALLYLAVFGSVIGFGAYFALVARIGAGAAAYATLLFPLVALSISTLFEDYQWSLPALIGLAMILLGNGVMFYKPRRKAVVAEMADDSAPA